MHKLVLLHVHQPLDPFWIKPPPILLTVRDIRGSCVFPHFPFHIVHVYGVFLTTDARLCHEISNHHHVQIGACLGTCYRSSLHNLLATAVSTRTQKMHRTVWYISRSSVECTKNRETQTCDCTLCLSFSNFSRSARLARGLVTTSHYICSYVVFGLGLAPALLTGTVGQHP